MTSDEANCVKVAIPCDRVTYIPRYKEIDLYRESLSNIKAVYEQFPDLFSVKAKEIMVNAEEEEIADHLVKDINTITGKIARKQYNLVKKPEDKSMLVLERQDVQLALNSIECSKVYLAELGREQLYEVRYFPYHLMEV